MPLLRGIFFFFRVEDSGIGQRENQNQIKQRINHADCRKIQICLHKKQYQAEEDTGSESFLLSDDRKPKNSHKNQYHAQYEI